MKIMFNDNKESNLGFYNYVSSKDKKYNDVYTYLPDNWFSDKKYDAAIKLENDLNKNHFVLHTKDDWYLRKNNYTIESEAPGNNEVVWKKNLIDQANLSIESTDDLFAKIIDIKEIIVRRPRPTTNKGRFLLMQQWEGYVLQVNEDAFVALIYDQTNSKNDPEEVELPLEEVSTDDRDLLQEGAVFYWSIGYEDLPNGERRRTSIIRFRRLPTWSKRELQSIREKVMVLKSRLDANNPFNEIASV